MNRVNVRLNTNVSETSSVSITVSVRSDYNSLIFISVSLDDVLFLLAQSAVKGVGVNLSRHLPPYQAW